MRILVANSFYAPEFGGGAERVLHALAQGLIARGHEVMAFATGEQDVTEWVDGVLVRRVPIDNAFRKINRELPGTLARAVWQLRDRVSPLTARRFEDAVRSFRPDIVHFHNLSGLSHSLWQVPAAMGIPSIQVLHDLYLICPPSTMFRNGRNCRSRCTSCRTLRIGFAEASQAVSAVVGVSRFVLDRVTAEGLFANRPQRVIYNAIAQPISPSVEPSPVRAPDQHGIRFGYIGVLERHKGAAWLIEQFDDSLGELLIAGTGSEAYVAELRRLAAGKSVRFLGFVPSNAFFRMIDVAVVPSLWNDTLPGVAIEASAHGKPVIASLRGGLPEIVADGESGILVDPDRPDSLGVALHRLAEAPEERARMGANALHRAAGFTDLARVLDTYEALHRELVSQDQPQSARRNEG